MYQVSIYKTVNPLTVAFNKSNKPRLELDCRHIHPHLHTYRSKYEDGKVAREIFDVVVSYYSKSEYHHIEIFEERQQYLGFAWFFEGKILFFVFSFLTYWYFYCWLYFSKALREVANISDLKTKK